MSSNKDWMPQLFILIPEIWLCVCVCLCLSQVTAGMWFYNLILLRHLISKIWQVKIQCTETLKIKGHVMNERELIGIGFIIYKWASLNSLLIQSCWFYLIIKVLVIQCQWIFLWKGALNEYQKVPVYHVSLKIQTEPQHQSKITHHTSTCWTDTSTLTELLSFT